MKAIFIVLIFSGVVCAQQPDESGAKHIASSKKDSAEHTRLEAKGISSSEKISASEKAERERNGVFVFPNRAVFNGKEYLKTEHSAIYSSSNMEYFLLLHTDIGQEYGNIARLIDKTGQLLWETKNRVGRGNRPWALVSNNGLVALFYGEFTPSILKIIDKTGKVVKQIQSGDSLSGDILENLYMQDVQFAKGSELLFVLAYFTEKKLVLLGIDNIGEVKYFEKVNPAMRSIRDWYARIYYNSSRNRVLIDSSGIGATPPTLTYWAFPQKLVFSKKADNIETILNASYADNGDILLLVKKKDVTKIIRRLHPDGKEAYARTDVTKMGPQERDLWHEKPVKVKSLNWGVE